MKRLSLGALALSLLTTCASYAQPVPPPPAGYGGYGGPPSASNQPNALPTSPPPGAPDGQWAYTDQYGWVWVPYSSQYTYAPDSGQPSMYVFGVSFGWRWVAAPWVIGVGPEPRWSHGTDRYAWHGYRGREERDRVGRGEPGRQESGRGGSGHGEENGGHGGEHGHERDSDRP